MIGLPPRRTGAFLRLRRKSVILGLTLATQRDTPRRRFMEHRQ